MALLTEALIAAVAIVGGLLLATRLPTRVLLFVLGALLPVWSIGRIPPEVFDLARYGLGLALSLRLWFSGAPANAAIRSWATPLALTGAIVAAFSALRGESPVLGVLMLASTLAAWFLIGRISNPWPLYVGFASGVTLSSLVVVASAVGIGFADLLVPNADGGYSRLTGLSTSAVRLSVEIAIAIAILFAAYRSHARHALAILFGVVICSLGLLMSGGRTGVVGLGLALIVAVLRRWLRPAVAIATIGVVAFAVSRSGQPGTFNSIDRLLGTASASESDYTSGRIELLAEAWNAWLSSPLIGNGDSYAHFVPLYFASFGGLLAGVLIFWLVMRLAVIPFLKLGDDEARPETVASVLIAVIFFASAMVEPQGPFVGFAFIVMLFASVAATSRDAKAPALQEATRSHGALLSAGGGGRTVP